MATKILGGLIILESLKAKNMALASATERTIASGVISRTQAVHTVDTQNDAASDDLDSITGGAEGDLLFLKLENATRNVVLKHAIGTDLIKCPGGIDITLDVASDFALLIHNGTQWVVIASSVSSNAVIASGVITGDQRLKTASQLTIAAGAVAKTQGYHTLDTEAASASDDLDDITGGTAGDLLFVQLVAAARNVVLRHAIGANKIATPDGVNITLDLATDWALLLFNGTQWTVLAYSSATTSASLTIAAGAVAAVSGAPVLVLDTEAAAATDDLDDITGGVAGQMVLLRIANAGRNVVVRHAIGANKIATPNGLNLILDVTTDMVLLRHNGTQWTVIGMSLLTESVIADPGNGGAIPVNLPDGACAIVSAGAETRTLAIPTRVGQRLTLFMDTDGGDVVITSAQAVNAVGNTSLTFNDAGDVLDLVAISVGSALRWRIVENIGVTLA